jgi:formamidopyrimidine-DNA glycosylase
MIELPEAIVIARQINAELQGQRITLVQRGNAPHKFAFYTATEEEYATILPGKVVGLTREHGSNVVVPVEPGYLLVLGGGGERILLHASEREIPKKHQLLLGFESGAYLSVTVQGWGSAMLLTPEGLANHAWLGGEHVSPLSEAFTWDYFQGLFGQIESEANSVKYFLISKPGVFGIGNGCLQDILFYARLHPRHRVVELDETQRRGLYDAIRQVLDEMLAQGGRDSEHDLYNRPGGYVRILDSRTVGQPCPRCGDLIEKAAFLGGAVYYCPTCQE